MHGFFWRRFLDWGVRNLPAILHRPLIWIAAFLFFFVAAPARKSVLRNLRLIRPASWRVMNCLRVLRVFTNFGWSLTDAATYRMSKTRFKYELEGGRFLDQLAAARGGVVLTAHMGNYDLGAALFAEKFHRQIQMVRAPEPDALAAQHVDLALQQSSAGAVKVGYSSDGTSLAFDLLNALRSGEIISIQGDRVVGEVARAPVRFFNREILLPDGALCSFARFRDTNLSALHRPDRLSQIQDHCARTNSSFPQRGIAGRSHRRCDAELGASVGRSGQLLLATMVRLYPVVLKTARARLSSGSPVANTTARTFRQRTSR